MGFRLLADATAVFHFLFVAYVVTGGYLAWYFRRTIWLHVLAVVWGFSTVVFTVDCPLTTLENWARHRAGEAGLPPSGFIDHYLTGVLYPREDLQLVRMLVVVAVVVSWLGFWLRGRHRQPGHAVR
ncbi:DUF2784 domain-containing protein [Nocardia stercoris]|uniref:DUF2784 domain-containing protein n=1 Tax=Nocardia stercoris TaxID=2483361 RepID=A0A3M2L7K9_9NOCA|nr:DUF2784 domain-containing protein [Nocardia stercoris]RMI33527.1 DUF2784 domain-containing protein [Nocardia stercoris]